MADHILINNSGKISIKVSMLFLTAYSIKSSINRTTIFTRLNHLFDQERKQGHIDKKFRLTFYPARKRSKQLKYGK